MKLLVCLLLASVLSASAQTNVVPLNRQYRDQAVALERQKLNFDQIFAKLCQQVLDDSAKDTKLELDDHARSMFGGLWQWVTGGGHPALQGRTDWSQHFVGGGAFEGYLDAGPRAAVTKETMDSHKSDNRYDLDDLAATMLGSRWMDLATHGTPEQKRQWITLWAQGKMTLSQTLPKLHYGQMAKGEQARAEIVEKIREDCATALKLPDEAPSPPH